MKDRSYRLPAHDQSDDWVNGSWTVDCVCGVDYDDGEEMVNCDECGVWVHTRCSRFVKGEKSFACDKCKSTNSRNDSEETEVAQLLVELPTKTMKLAPSNNTENWTCPSDSNRAPAYRPYGLWTERPMEERVHVQGIPGGESSFFHGLSSNFTAQLWKCSGYVPKRFNLRYREFPVWDEQQKNDENVDEKEAVALYSLSEEAMLCSPEASALAGMRTQSKVDIFSGILKKSSKARKLKSRDTNNTGVQHNVKEERSLFNPVLFHTGKRKGGDAGTSKERSMKKKIKEHDNGKKKSSILKSEHDEEKGQNVQGTDVKPTVFLEGASDAYQASYNNSEKHRSKAVTTEGTQESLLSKNGRHKQQEINDVIADKDQKSCSIRADTCLTTDVVPSSSVLDDHAKKSSAVKEVVLSSNQNIDQGDCASSSVIDLHNVKLMAGDTYSVARQLKSGDSQMKEEADVSVSCLHPDTKLSTNSTDNDLTGNMKVDMMKNVNQSTHISGNSRVIYAEASNTDVYEHKAQIVHKRLEAVSENKPCASRGKVREEMKGLPGHKLEVKAPLSEYEQLSKTVEETSIFDVANPKPPVSSLQCGNPPSGRPHPSSSTTVMSRSSSADKCASTNSHPLTSKRSICNSAVYTKKDRVLGDATEQDSVKNEDKEVQGVIVKDCPKSSVNDPGRDTSDSGRPSDNVVFKYKSSSSKNAVSSRAPESSTPPPAVASLLQHQKVTARSHSKNITSTLQSSGEKSAPPSFKAGQASLGNPAAASNPPPAGLSDEELALLLHQELNSSPRVPRIPRVRNAGGLPQLSSTAPSVSGKRTSSSGGKDHYMFSRRKNKDDRKDGSSSCFEQQREVRRMERVPSSPDSSKTADEGPSHPSRRNSKQASLTAGPSMVDGNEHKFLSERSSPHNNSEEDTGTKGAAHRTLPGLIAEIMSKGERMTYEELCSAVFPHWHNLRKQNGERYAYASHSQAVLDCLRNRVEWACLVDRGPKTNANRKRKFDTEPTDSESDDNECAEERSCGRGSKRGVHSASSKEDFPKGKRNARRRRRLAVQGKGIGDVKKRRKTKVVLDDEEDDDATVSSSSCSDEQSAFSEDDRCMSMGQRAGSEVSAATSDDYAET